MQNLTNVSTQALLDELARRCAMADKVQTMLNGPAAPTVLPVVYRPKLEVVEKPKRRGAPRGETRQRILWLLEKRGAMSIARIERSLGIQHAAQQLHRLTKESRVVKVRRGVYKLSEAA